MILKQVSSINDAVNLQSDLESLQYWEKKWLLKFNASKCHVLKITRATEHELKYLGIAIQSYLKWSQHIHHIATRANCMCFITHQKKS